MNKRAVILLSGGIDSATTTAVAKEQGYEIYALSFDYGQRHKVELHSAKRVAESLEVKRHLIIGFDLREIGGSALTSEIAVPKDGGKKKDDIRQMIPITYVPARNTIFLSFALAWAEVLEAPDIFIGANAVDYSGYPDCRPEYLKSFEDLANLATKISVEGKIKFSIKAPLLYMTKAEIIKKGVELGLDYSLTWSCYDPQKRKEGEEVEKILTSDLLTLFSEYVPCGKCESCQFRAKGFREADIEDPLIKLLKHI